MPQQHEDPLAHGATLALFAPRGDGTLQDFRAWPTPGRTDIFGDVAQHWCSYAQSGVQDGEPITGGGWRSLPLVRTTAGWRISAVARDDDRPHPAG